MVVQVLCPNPRCGASNSITSERLGRDGCCERCGELIPLSHPGDGSRPGSVLANPGRSSAASNPSRVASARPSLAPVELPEQFGRYRIMKILGQGGMGAVYLAHDIQLDRRVALKVPHFSPEDGPQVVNRFYQEARAAATFDHPNLCPVHDVGQTDGIHYLTMPYIEGKPLSEVIDPDKPLPHRQVAAVIHKLALALGEAHRLGVIHRDLKPANIMASKRRELVIMDFGLARRAESDDARLTKTGSIMGTPSYMAPEQVAGNQAAMGPGCDIYSLGVIMYEMLTGRLPFEGPISLVLGLIMVADPPPPSTHRPEIDRELEAICLKAMAKKVGDRYATMDEMAAALNDYLTKTSRQARPQPSVDLAAVSRSPNTGGPGFSEESLAAGFFARLAAEQASISLAPTPRTVPSPPRRKPPRRLWLAAAGASALLFLGVVIYVATDKGRIKITVNDPQAVVQVDHDLVRIETLGEPLILRAGEHELLVKSGDGESKYSKFTVHRGDNDAIRVEFEPLPQPPPGTVAIGAGLTTAVGAYRADIPASGSTAIGGTFGVSIDTSNVDDPAPQQVYQFERFGDEFSYTIPNLTPGGAYKVRLHNAENNYNTPGDRLFHVALNGERVLSDYDVLAAAGAAHKAVVQSLEARADAAGRITISFTNVKGGAKIHGIELKPIPVGRAKAGKQWEYDGGYFKDEGGGRWTERSADGTLSYTFAETHKNSEFFELYDQSRDCHVRLFDTEMHFRTGDGNNWAFSKNGRWR
jgi:serine/threonine protein kinase